MLQRELTPLQLAHEAVLNAPSHQLLLACRQSMRQSTARPCLCLVARTSNEPFDVCMPRASSTSGISATCTGGTHAHNVGMRACRHMCRWRVHISGTCWPGSRDVLAAACSTVSPGA